MSVAAGVAVVWWSFGREVAGGGIGGGGTMRKPPLHDGQSPALRRSPLGRDFVHRIP